MILQSQVLASGLVRTFVKPREGEQEIYQSGFLVPGKRVWGFRRYVREGTQDEVEGRLADTAPGEHISQSLRQLHRRVDGAGAQCVLHVAVRAGGGFRVGVTCVMCPNFSQMSTKRRHLKDLLPFASGGNFI